ncbi:MAG: membrane dipeptidase [Verrucomicrobiota bacterium]
MKKLTGLFLLASAGVSVAAEESKTWPASDKAKKFVKDSIVVGYHGCMYGAGWTEDKHLHDYMNRSRAAGITGHDWTIAAAGQTFDYFLKEHQKNRSVMAQTPGKYVFVRSVRDIEHAHVSGKTAVNWVAQTSTILDGDLNKMATLKEMGVNTMILSYNDLFRAGSGCLAEFNGNTTGVTNWGLSVLDEMVKYGVVVDLSHMGPKTCMGVMDHMEKNHPGVPVIYSHSLPSGLYKDGPNATERGCYRNISDEEAIRCAKTGGYVAPTFTEWMMDGIWPDDVTPQQCADMFDYYVKLVGIDHVALATDDYFTTAPTMDFVKKNADSYDDDGYMIRAFDKGATGSGELAKILAAITDELWKRGYKDEDLKKIYGGNKMRVYEQVWEGGGSDKRGAKAEEEFMEVLMADINPHDPLSPVAIRAAASKEWNEER